LLAFIATMPVVEIIFHFDELKHGLFELIAERIPRKGMSLRVIMK